MRLGRIHYQGEEIYGLVEGDALVEVRRGGEGTGDAGERERRVVPLSEARLLAPAIPSKIIAVGLNYRLHAAEMNKSLPESPLIFMKPATAVIGPGDAVRLPAQSQHVEFEGELGVVIGRHCRNVAESDALQFVLGYTCVNDVTARDLQARDVQYTRAKGFDTFAPVGPFLATDIDPANLRLRTYVNGELRQDASTSDLIFSVPRLIAFISSVMTLLPGDIISTGTPSGVGPLAPGDRVEVDIEGIGRLSNPVLQDESSNTAKL